MESIAQELKQESVRKNLDFDTADVFHLLETNCVYCCAMYCGAAGPSEPLGCPPPPDEGQNLKL